MNSPSKTATVFVLAIFWSRTFLFAADATKDPLWRKAVAVATANADWVPGLVIIRSEVLHKGQTVGVHEIWQRSKLGPKGEVMRETVKILEDGKDVTKPEKKKSNAKSEAKKTGGNEGGHPFDAAVQDQLSLKMMDRSRTIAGRDCVGYAFELRNTNGPVVRGTAWLEKGTGVPSEIENMTLDPLPDKRFKHLTLTTRYETTTNGTWLARTMTANITMSVIFIKADARLTTTFSEHWKKPPHKTAPTNDKNQVRSDD
jgi:hypothetical protein